MRARHAFWVFVYHLVRLPARLVRLLGRIVMAPLRLLAAGFWILVLFTCARLSRRFRGGQRLYWGPDPIISIKYWSDAMRASGADSTTVVSGGYPIYEGTRFDLSH